MSQGWGALAAPPSVRTDKDAESPASRSRCSIGQSSTPLAMQRGDEHIARPGRVDGGHASPTAPRSVGRWTARTRWPRARPG